jgi:hypothetical protein
MLVISELIEKVEFKLTRIFSLALLSCKATIFMVFDGILRVAGCLRWPLAGEIRYFRDSRTSHHNELLSLAAAGVKIRTREWVHCGVDLETNNIVPMFSTSWL